MFLPFWLILRKPANSQGVLRDAFFVTGFFEVSDLLLNTAGTFFGAAVAVMGRKVFGLDNI